MPTGYSHVNYQIHVRVCLSPGFIGQELDVHNMSVEELTTLQNSFNGLQVCVVLIARE